MNSQSDRWAGRSELSPQYLRPRSVDTVVDDDPEILALWAAAMNADSYIEAVAASEAEVLGASWQFGDVVRLTAREGGLKAGETGVVIDSFRYSDCKLVMVKFGRRTRVVQSTSIEEVHASDPAPRHARPRPVAVVEAGSRE